MKDCFFFAGIFCFLWGGFSCSSESPEIQINFSTASAEAFQDANIVDLVFFVESLESDKGILDLNQDGKKDQFVFPDSCKTNEMVFPPSCGFSLVSSTSKLSLGNLPLNFSYSLEAQLRNNSGQKLYNGTLTFSNDGTPQTLSMTLQKVNP